MNQVAALIFRPRAIVAERCDPGVDKPRIQLGEIFVSDVAVGHLDDGGRVSIITSALA